MELWIRSQDKERLRLIDSLRIYQEEEQIGFNIQDGGCILGTYKTKERALEVLDEIHDHLEKMYWFNPQVENDRRLRVLTKSYVYNMPLE